MAVHDYEECNHIGFSEAVNSMTGVLNKGRDFWRKTDTQRKDTHREEDYVITKAEIGVMLMQAKNTKNYWQTPKGKAIASK